MIDATPRFVGSPRFIGLVMIGVMLRPVAGLTGEDTTPAKGEERAAPFLEVPEQGALGEGFGKYTGFNSLNLQQIYVVEKQPAVRSQIMRGWGKPIIVRLPSGDLLASQYKYLAFERNPKYPDAVEEAALCRSRDEGFSWSAPKLLGIPGRVAQLTALRDGTLIMAAGHMLYRSTDEGESWHKCPLDSTGVERGGNGSGLLFEETNGVTELADGALICGAYVSLGPGKPRSYILRSRDGGRTWGDASFVTEASEISYLQLPSGKILGFARVAVGGVGEGGAAQALVESTDNGRHWTAPRSFGLGQAQNTAFPLRLKDGRLILVYGHRQFPFGAQVIGSHDEGKTWDLKHPIILAWFSWDEYCGHPRSLLMPDGSIMTGYYTRMYKGGRSPSLDIVSHALRWRVPDNWPPKR